MSLQVWLPLTGDLHNQGLANISISNLNSSTYTNGKLGQALYLTTDNQGLSLDNYMNVCSSYTSYTMAAWVYLDNTATNHSSSILSSGNWNSGASQCTFGLYNYSSGYSTLLVPNKTGWSNGISLTNKIVLNTWYHIAIIYDGSTTKGYVNGEYIGTYSGGGITSSSENSSLYIGRATYYSGFTLKGKINDVRIYNHCLSPREVKEISKGLVLHYPLNDLIPRNGNDILYMNKNTSSSESQIIQYRLPVGQYNNSFTAIQTSTSVQMTFYLDKSVSSGTLNFIGAYSTDSTTVEDTYYGDITISAGTYSETISSIELDALYKNSKYKSGYAKYITSDSEFSSIVITYPAILSGNSIGSILTGTNTSVTIQNANGSNTYNENLIINTGSNVNFYFFDFNFIDNDNIYDTSGYSNNGTKSGIMTISYSSPRYNSCYCFSGNEYITANFPNNKNTTFSVWVYFNSNSGTHVLDCRPNGVGTQPMYITTTGIQIGGSSNGSYPTVSYNFNLNTWYLVTVVYNETNNLVYVNGNLAGTTTAKGYDYGIGTLYLGSRYSNAYKLNGYISDFRIYATALSAADIKELYDTPIAIANNGTLMTQGEVVE